ncbi:MAG: hypothetical protein V3V19_11320 [Cocleimonas sp.]
MGAATIAVVSNVPRVNRKGSLKELIRDVTMNASYATGGDTLDLAAALNLRSIIDVKFDTATYILQYDKTNGKILAYYADYDAGADGALIQVANAVDLAAALGAIRTTITAK